MDDQVTQMNGLREALRAISGKEPDRCKCSA